MDEKKTIDVLQKLKNNYNILSKGHKLIARFLLSNYEKAAFMTASKLADKVGVSEATVVRFANSLGYDGYPKLKKALQDIIKSKLTTIQRIDMSQTNLDNKFLIKNILISDINNIRYTLDEFNEYEFEKVVDLIVNAKNIYIVGFRTTTILTEYLGYYLNLLLDNVRVINYGVGDVYEQLIKANKGDLVIGISFPRYSAKTSETVTYLKEKGLDIVAITDNETSPITKFCDHYLIAKSNISSFVDTLVAPLSLINALIIAVGFRNKENTKNIFNELERVWAEHYIYAKYDDED